MRQHVDRCHEDQTLFENPQPSIQDIEPDQLEALLTDAMAACEVEYVRRFLPRASEEISNKLYGKAVATSTAAVVELFINSGKDIDKILLDTADPNTYLVPLIVAIRAMNVEIAKFLLDRGCDLYKANTAGEDKMSKVLDYAMMIPELDVSIEMIMLLFDHGVDLRKRHKHLVSMLPSFCGHDLQVIKQLELFKFALKKGDDYNDVLKFVPRRNCSVDIAEFLLRNGADVNTRGISASARNGTPLYIAAGRTTVEAAKFMKFLLEFGADPYVVVGGRTAGELPGARNISRWLGMTWDELVESTAAARADYQSSQAASTKT